MIHEEICTYEVAKLAEEKGFPQAFNYTRFKSGLDYYNHKGKVNGDVGDILKLRIKHNPVPEEMKPITAPTQSLLQRWLREEKGYYVYPFFDNVQLKWDWVCREKTGDKWIPLVGYDFHLFDTYELALEDALKYALSNLV